MSRSTLRRALMLTVALALTAASARAIQQSPVKAYGAIARQGQAF